MAKVKTVCTLCGEKSKSTTPPVSCPICNVSLDNSKEEVLKIVKCVTSENTSLSASRPGMLHLTNTRLFWLVRPTKWYFRGPGLFEIVMDAIFRKPMVMKFSFRLDEITGMEIAKKGPFKMLKLTAGDKTVAIDIKSKHIQEWIDDINSAKEKFISQLQE